MKIYDVFYGIGKIGLKILWNYVGEYVECSLKRVEGIIICKFKINYNNLVIKLLFY